MMSTIDGFIAAFGRGWSLVHNEVRASGRRASVVPSGIMFLILAVTAGPARAGTSEGTLITNVAVATYAASDFTPYTVSFSSTATVLVANPSLSISKVANPTIECAGGTITFCIYVKNNSAYTSAFNVYVTDKIPTNISYVAGQSWWAGSSAGATILFGYGHVGIPDTFMWNSGGANPDSFLNGFTSNDSYSLRWIISPLGPNGRSAMVCWKGVIL